MPNHCSNSLTVNGPAQDLALFWTAIDDKEQPDQKRLAQLVPMPDELTGPDGGWYSWAIENWGTKWGDYEHCIAIDGPDYLELGYNTAWAPFEDHFWHKVSRMFPTLTFTVSYEESGMVFCGAATYRNGETLASRYVNDYTEIIGALDDEDDEKWEKWQDRLAELREDRKSVV